MCASEDSSSSCGGFVSLLPIDVEMEGNGRHDSGIKSIDFGDRLTVGSRGEGVLRDHI